MVVSEVMGMEKIFLRYFINGKERRSKMMTWETATIKNAERERYKGNQETSREGGKGSEESVKKSRCTGYLVLCKLLHNGLAKTTIRMYYLTICRSGILKECSKLVLTPDRLMMLLPRYHLVLQSLKAWIRLKYMLPRQFTYVAIVKKASASHLMNFFIKERHNMSAKLPGSGWSKRAKEEDIASLWPSLRSHTLSFLHNPMSYTHQLHSVCVWLWKAQDGSSWRTAPLQGRWLSKEVSGLQYKRKILFYMTTHHFSIPDSLPTFFNYTMNFLFFDLLFILILSTKSSSIFPLLPYLHSLSPSLLPVQLVKKFLLVIQSEKPLWSLSSLSHPGISLIRHLFTNSY